MMIRKLYEHVFNTIWRLFFVCFNAVVVAATAENNDFLLSYLNYD